MIGFIILGVVALAGTWGATKVFPKFGQAVRINLGGLLGKTSTPLEREKDRFNQLKARIPEQRNKVAAVIASSNIAKKDLETLKGQLLEAERRYKLARTTAGVSEETINSAAQRYSDVNTKIQLKEKELQTYSDAAKNAVQIMEETATALEQFKNRIDMDESTENLTDVLNMSAEATQQAKDLLSDITSVNGESAEIRKRHEEALARNTLSQGSTADRELNDLDRKSKAQSARDELDAKLGLAVKPAEAPGTSTVELDDLLKSSQSGERKTNG